MRVTIRLNIHALESALLIAATLAGFTMVAIATLSRIEEAGPSPAPIYALFVYPDPVQQPKGASNMRDGETPVSSSPKDPCRPLNVRLLKSLVSSAAATYKLDESLLERMVLRESAGNPCAVSKRGALGLMQLMPGTAKHMRVVDPQNPAQNLDAGARYLRYLIDRYRNIKLAVAAYNAGPGPVDRFRGVPPFAETRAYVADILMTED